MVLEAAVVAFCDPAQEILVFSPDRPGFARVIYNPAEVVDQTLRQGPLEASTEAEDCGYRLTLTARAYACDVFCMVDKVDPAASTDGGMATILSGPGGRCLSARHFPPPRWLANWPPLFMSHACQFLSW
ncbi:hypothetical protein [Bifidobacterium apis]|uniref:hypothetical protein n=1 Tax=Bifidobacterium apis TaxID=3081440 RepID=UPI0030D78A54